MGYLSGESRVSVVDEFEASGLKVAGGGGDAGPLFCLYHSMDVLEPRMSAVEVEAFFSSLGSRPRAGSIFNELMGRTQRLLVGALTAPHGPVWMEGVLDPLLRAVAAHRFSYSTPSGDVVAEPSLLISEGASIEDNLVVSFLLLVERMVAVFPVQLEGDMNPVTGVSGVERLVGFIIGLGIHKNVGSHGDVDNNVRHRSGMGEVPAAICGGDEVVAFAGLAACFSALNDYQWTSEPAVLPCYYLDDSGKCFNGEVIGSRELVAYVLENPEQGYRLGEFMGRQGLGIYNREVMIALACVDEGVALALGEGVL